LSIRWPNPSLCGTGTNNIYDINAEMVLVLKYLLTLVSQQILVQLKIVFFGLPQLEKDIVLFIINSPG